MNQKVSLYVRQCYCYSLFISTSKKKRVNIERKKVQKVKHFVGNQIKQGLLCNQWSVIKTN